MRMQSVLFVAVVGVLGVGAAGLALTTDIDDTDVSATGSIPAGEAMDLDWDLLVPEADEASTQAGVVVHEQLSDDAAPWQINTDVTAVRHELDGKRVRIPGYMTPLTFEDAEVGEFLLVPYVGACVHVPPPDANQIVYVKATGTVPVLEMWEPFYAVGTLRTEAQSTDLAEVGYSMDLEHMEVYEYEDDAYADPFEDPSGT